MLRTTVREIASRAGVERATVYRHFADERALIHACTGHYFAQNPPPDPTPWLAEADPVIRLHMGLAEVYRWHDQTEPMMTRTLPELPDVPAAQEVAAPLLAHMDRLRDVLATGWDADEAQRPTLLALIGHALSFSTWKSLVREQCLDSAQAVEAMVRLVRGYAVVAATTPAGFGVSIGTEDEDVLLAASDSNHPPER